MSHAIELVDVHAGYGRIEILHGVDLAVPSGTVYALLGPNGGGKSTTLRVIVRRDPPDLGLRPHRRRARQRCQLPTR